VDLSPLWTVQLTAPGLGGVVALCVACFVGWESVLAFSEEARSHTGVRRAVFGSLAVLGVLYTVSAVAVYAATGPAGASAASADTVFTVVRAHLGRAVMTLASLLLVTSIVAAMISLHQTVARYLYVLTRERLLPAGVGRVLRGHGVPVGGSLVASAVGLVVIAVWAGLGLDPMLLFTQLAALAAVGIVTLMVVCCLAVLVYYHRHGGGRNESGWVRVGAPSLGAVALGLLLALMVLNLGTLTGTTRVWLLPALIGAAALVGLVWGLALRLRRLDVLAGVGRGETEPLAELEHHLADVRI
jgi:amino acid transporter